jgi:hypothetical protein
MAFGSKSDEEHDNLLGRAAMYFMSDEFQEPISMFVSENCMLFRNQMEYADADFDDEDAEEYLKLEVTRGHSLDQHRVYEDFQSIFDQQMETFIDRNEVDKFHFLRLCRRAIDESDEGRETMGSVFVELLLATADYEGFVAMMASEASKQIHRK